MYLIGRDYLKTIQDANLLQVITSNKSIQASAEVAAQAEAISYLRQKYDTTKEFTNTNLWLQTNPYSAGDRVYLDASAYSATSTYAVDDLALQGGVVYRCNTEITAGEAFNSAKWDALGAQGLIFYGAYPFGQFDLYAAYNVGDKVFYKGKVYTAIVSSTTTSHEVAIQYNQISNLPAGNVFPDDAKNGSNYWKFEEVYLIPADSDILNASLWVQGDNRDAQMVEKLVDITLYHLHSRITPLNIPKVREVRYMGNPEDRFAREGGGIAFPIYSALGWLQGCARGEVTPNLPKIQPKKGARIRFGGQVRNINSY